MLLAAGLPEPDDDGSGLTDRGRAVKLGLEQTWRYSPGLLGDMIFHHDADLLTEQVRQFIMLSPSRAWTAHDIASRLALSVPTLRRKLREESQSFRQIVEEVRMAVALSQLQSTRLPIGEIALQCGYLSSSRFTARFRQHYGCLPKTLR